MSKKYGMVLRVLREETEWHVVEYTVGLSTSETFIITGKHALEFALELSRAGIPMSPFNILYNERVIEGKFYAEDIEIVTSEKVQESKVGVRYDAGKLRLQDVPPEFEKMLGEIMTENPGLRIDLIPKLLIVELARVYTEGAKKYADRNWEKGLPWLETFGAGKRHQLKWRMGETRDKELGTHHLAQAIWNLAALLEFEKTHPEMDNRNLKKED